MSTPILILDPSSRVLPYEQIITQIRLHIATARLPPGVILPSVRQLAHDLGIATNTVLHAYRELEREGWVIASARGGVRVAFLLPSQVAQFRTHEFERAVRNLLLTAQQFGMTPAEIYAEIDRHLSSFPHLGSRG
jgi:GntR family transcriptional regulator